MEKQQIFLYQENFRGCDILKNPNIHVIKAVNKLLVSEKQREVGSKEVKIHVL